MESTRANTVLTPCIKLCVIDSAYGLCGGCGRSLAEIGGWLGFSDVERRAVMAVLPARLATLSVSAPSPEAVR